MNFCDAAVGVDPGAPGWLTLRLVPPPRPPVAAVTIFAVPKTTESAPLTPLVCEGAPLPPPPPEPPPLPLSSINAPAAIVPAIVQAPLTKARISPRGRSRAAPGNETLSVTARVAPVGIVRLE